MAGTDPHGKAEISNGWLLQESRVVKLLSSQMPSQIEYMVVVYAVLIGLAVLLAVVLESAFFGISGVVLAFSTVQISSLFAGLGPGRYAWRALYAFGAAAFVGFGLVIGAYAGLAISGEWQARWLVTTSLIQAASWALLYWVLGQLPHLGARYLLGWRIADESQPDEDAALSIAELLSITAVCAVGFAAPGLAGMFEQSQFSGTILFTSVVGVVQATACLVFVILPATWYLLHPFRHETGCSWLFFYFSFLIIAVTMLLFGLGPPSPNVPLVFGFLLFGYACAICLPLMFARQAGLVLWTAQRTRAWHALERDEQQWSAERLGHSPSETPKSSDQGTSFDDLQ